MITKEGRGSKISKMTKMSISLYLYSPYCPVSVSCLDAQNNPLTNDPMHNLRWRHANVQRSDRSLWRNRSMSMYNLWEALQRPLHEIHVSKLSVDVTTHLAQNPWGEWRFKTLKCFYVLNSRSPLTPQLFNSASAFLYEMCFRCLISAFTFLILSFDTSCMRRQMQQQEIKKKLWNIY